MEPLAFLFFLVSLVRSSLLLATPAGIPVSGQVLDAAGKPVQGASVRLVPIPRSSEALPLELAGRLHPEPVSRASPDAQGRFEVTAPEAGMWTVIVESPGRVSRQHPLVPLFEPLELPPVRLPDAGRLEILVVDAAGKPAAGARIHLSNVSARVFRDDGSFDPWEGVSWGATTGANGKAVAPVVEGERWIVSALAPGSPSVRAEGAGRETAVRLILKTGREGPPGGADRQRPVPAPSPLLAGRVVDAVSREPVAGAFVWPSQDPGAFVQTDAGGFYAVALTADRPGMLQAASPEHLPASEMVQPARAEASRTGPTFALQPASLVTGAVVDGHDRSIAGAELRFHSVSGSAGRSFRPVSSTHSDARGRFRLRLPAGASYDVEVRHPGWAPASAEIPAVEPRTARDLRIVLEKGGSAFGRVADSREQPVAGARVRLALLPDAEDLRQARNLDEIPVFATVTDAEGRFELQKLPAGRFDLEARAPGRPPVVVRGITVDGETRAVDLGTVVLPDGVPIEGTVVDSGERPVQEAEIRILRLDSPGLPLGERAETVTSGADGRFTIPGLQEGRRVELRAWKEGYAGIPSTVEVPATAPVRLVLQPGARIAGQVVGEDGRPVPWAQVDISRESSSQGILVAEEGRFEQAGLEPGEITLRATGQGHLPWERRITLAAGEEIEDLRIVLRRGAVVAGRVLGPDGSPVPGAEVEIVESLASPFPVRETADGEGRYRLEGVAEGRRSIAASHPDFQRSALDLDVRSGENRLDLQLGRGFPVTGRIVDAEGRSVEGALIVLSRDWEPHLFTPVVTQVASGADGSFRFSSMEPGTYAIRATKEGYGPAEPRERVQVATAPVEGLELRLPTSGAVVRGRILGVAAERLADLQISAVHEVAPNQYGEVRRGWVDVAGRYEIRGLFAGEWLVGGQSAGAVTVERIRLAEGTAEETLDLDFSGALTLSGTVRRAGEPAPGVHVSAFCAEAGDGADGTIRSRGARSSRTAKLRCWTGGNDVASFGGHTVRRGFFYQNALVLSRMP